MLTFGSLFSGIEGFGVGLERAGMKCVWQVEKDESCLKVLRRHFPDVPKFTDVREVNAASVPVRPDWICGGFPCQDLSVAGRRAGLAGERSGLFFEFMRIVGELTPGGVLIENVPGLLSSNSGRDMGTVLRALDERGYGWAYRSLDAQYFGLAQRRERVFIVGCLGDMRRAAEILFERESLPWDSPPSRQAGARTAACLTSGVSTGSGVNRPGRRREDDTNIVSYALNAKNGKRFDGESETLVFSELGEGHQTYQQTNITTPVRGTGGGGINSNLVTHALRSEGADASEDGTGRGTPLCVVPIDMRQASRSETMTNNRREGSSGGAPGTGIGEEGDPSPTVSISHPPAVAFQTRIGRNDRGQLERICPTLQGASAGATSDMRPCVLIGGNNDRETATGVVSPGVSETSAATEVQAAIRSVRQPGENHQQDDTPAVSLQVRRLTPLECERLQGFPDDWTRYADDGKEISDSARYRMLGNAVAVPVSHWIGRRLVESQPPA